MTVQEAYRVLGFSMNDTVSEKSVKHRYRLLAAKLHPDVVGGSGQEFSNVAEAYSIIKRLGFPSNTEVHLTHENILKVIKVKS